MPSFRFTSRLSIRGMDASYDAYTLNGFGMPETDSSTRAISLNMLAPFGIQSMQVSKGPTPTCPAMRSAAPSTCARPARSTSTAISTATTAQGQFNTLASDLRQGQGRLAATGTGLEFGDDQAFGLYASAYYGKNNTIAQAPAPNSKYVPVDPAQANAVDAQAGTGAAWPRSGQRPASHFTRASRGA